MPFQTKIKWAAAVLAFIIGVGWMAARIPSELSAAAVDPGSAQDPIVTQSYVDAQINARMQSLTDQVYALQNKITLLENRINAGIPAQTSVTPTPAAGGGTQVQPALPGKPAAAKKVYPKKGLTQVNVRGGPATSYVILTKLKSTAPATLLSEKPGWYNIRLPDGRSAWVSKDVAEIR